MTLAGVAKLAARHRATSAVIVSVGVVATAMALLGSVPGGPDDTLLQPAAADSAQPAATRQARPRIDGDDGRPIRVIPAPKRQYAGSATRRAGATADRYTGTGTGTVNRSPGSNALDRYGAGSDIGNRYRQGTDAVDRYARGGTATGGSTGSGSTAAERHGWGAPIRVDDFSGGLHGDWEIYDGEGHGGNGRRTPEAVSVGNGVLTLTGDSGGNTAGMAFGDGQLHGRWEARVMAPESDPTYHALLLLWPDAEDWPVGGEVDFMEMMEPTRQLTNMFLHYGADNSQLDGSVELDATEWHNWAVEWAPGSITAYVDGRQWWHTDDTSTLPPGPMHLCIQLDWFPGDGDGGGVQESAMHVDWVREYAF